MNKCRISISLTLAALAVIATPAMAATAAPAKQIAATAHHQVPAKRVAMARMAAPARGATSSRLTNSRVASASPHGRMVTTRTSTGKTITYNCSLAGNVGKGGLPRIIHPLPGLSGPPDRQRPIPPHQPRLAA